MIAAYEARIEAARFDLAHVNRTLAIFEPKAGDPIADYFEIGRLWERGEIVSQCRAELAVNGALDTGELTDRVLAAKGIDNVGPGMRRRVVARVARAMANARTRGLVADAGKQDGVRVWSVKAPLTV